MNIRAISTGKIRVFDCISPHIGDDQASESGRLPAAAAIGANDAKASEAAGGEKQRLQWLKNKTTECPLRACGRVDKRHVRPDAGVCQELSRMAPQRGGIHAAPARRKAGLKAAPRERFELL